MASALRPTASGPSGGLLLRLLVCGRLLPGCDFFATQEFSPKPSDIRAFADAFAERRYPALPGHRVPGRPGSEAADTVLSSLRIRFFRAPDSLQEGDGWMAVSVRVLSDPPGAYRDDGCPPPPRGRRRPRSSRVRTTPPPGGAALLSAQGRPPIRHDRIPGPARGVHRRGLLGRSRSGVLEVDREIEAVDTLTVGNRLEESWRVAETHPGRRTVAGPGTVLVRGLRAAQRRAGLGLRGAGRGRLAAGRNAGIAARLVRL